MPESSAEGGPPQPVDALASVDPAAIFAFESLSIRYGQHVAVSDITFDIPKGVTAFIGPSGCGKSTTLRTMNRMHELIAGAAIDGGKLRYRDVNLYDPSVNVIEVRRRIGMIFQKPNPFPKSVYDNVAYGPRLGGVKRKKDLDPIVEKALRDAALWDEVKQKLGQSALNFSGGQQQRLCIARALAVEPDVLLMDEPCSALDPIATGKIEDLIGRMKSTHPIVIVTHNMAQAGRISDRTAFFLAEQNPVTETVGPGTLVEFGLTKDLFQNPSDPRTEAYITGRFG